MKALCWHSPKDIRCDEVPDPKIEHPRDAIIKVTSCAICGSDLHLYDGYMPGMEKGDVMGHEFMGEVVEVGADSKHALKVGDRVVIPFTIICGECEQCQRGNDLQPRAQPLMDFTTLIGLLAAFCTTVSYYPQQRSAGLRVRLGICR